MELLKYKKDKMDVVCNIDSNYVKYCVVMLVSLFENNKDEDISVHIISDKLPEKDKSLIIDSLKNYDNKFCFYDAGNEILMDCPISPDSYISISTYYRLFLPVILPASVSKVLYLDCDLIVMAQIKDLWNTDLTDYALGVVEDMWSSPIKNMQGLYERLGYDSKYSYFNAGVMLINLDYWRTHNILEHCLNYLQKYPERITLYDQDVLNAVLYDQKLFLSFKWNMQEGFYRRNRRIRKDVWKELDALLPNPSILHYVGEIKPWHKNADHPLASEWFVYLDKTLWKGERPPFDLWGSFRRLFKPVGYFLKIDKPKYRKF